MKPAILSLAILSLALLVVCIVNAHDTGPSIEVTKNGYVSDIGYESKVVNGGTQVHFDFNLYVSETNESVSYEDIWFRIEKDDNVYFAGGLVKQKFGTTGLTYRFTEAGNYTLYTRYATGSKPIIETTSEFEVLSVEETQLVSKKYITTLLPFSTGLIIGLIAWWLSKRRYSKT